MPESESAEAAIPSYVVIGTSMGGVNALTQIFKDLPAEFPAAVLVVMHVSAKSSNTQWLAERLTHAVDSVPKSPRTESRYGRGWLTSRRRTGTCSWRRSVCASVKAHPSNMRGPLSTHFFAAPRPPSGGGSSA